MKTVLVTGGAGFLGSHIAEQVIRNGHKAIIIDDLSGGVEANLPGGSLFEKMDICDVTTINRLFSRSRFDAVVHCAAFASENLSHNCRAHTYKNIVLGSANITNAAVNYGVPLVVSMSSIAVYGCQPPPFDEESPTLPIDPYGAAKACMEADLRAATDVFGLSHVIFRPHNIIGIRQSLADKTRNVASIFLRQVIEGTAMTVYGAGDQTRCFSPVGDVARVIAACIDRPDTWNETYNIGGDDPMTVLELAGMIRDVARAKNVNNNPTVVHLPERHEVKHAQSSHYLVKQMFADLYETRSSIGDCLLEMMDEAMKYRLPPVQSLPPIEIMKKLNPIYLK